MVQPDWLELLEVGCVSAEFVPPPTSAIILERVVTARESAWKSAIFCQLLAVDCILFLLCSENFVDKVVDRGLVKYKGINNHRCHLMQVLKLGLVAHVANTWRDGAFIWSTGL